MRDLHAGLVLLGLATLGLLAAGYADTNAFGEQTAQYSPPAPPTTSSLPPSTASQNEARPESARATRPPHPAVYRAALSPIGNSEVTGEALVRVKGEQLVVSVNATGLKGTVEHFQHIHQNAKCSSPGAPIVSLDDNIANNPQDATNAGPDDDAFPTATSGGTIHYRQKAARSAVESALGTELDLANRTVVIHAAGFPIGDATACGALNQVGN